MLAGRPASLALVCSVGYAVTSTVLADRVLEVSLRSEITGGEAWAAVAPLRAAGHALGDPDPGTSA